MVSNNKSDLVLKPDTSTVFMDPFFEAPTLNIRCDIMDPVHGTFYARDQCGAKRAEAFFIKRKTNDFFILVKKSSFFILIMYVGMPV